LFSTGHFSFIPIILYTQTILKLELDNIELSFDARKILSGIYLHGETGKVTGILGRNGCGKTSLLRILFGSLNPKYANIRLNEVHQKKKLFKTSKIAYLPQHKLLPNFMTLGEAFTICNVDWNDFIGLFHSFARYQKEHIKHLSSGELRLIETYLILNSKKEIILLDEPFSFIAPIYIKTIKTIINQKKKESILIISDHFYQDIMDISDTLYFLKDGYSKLITSKVELIQEGYLSA